MDSVRRGGSHITPGQKEILIDFIESHPKLNSGKFENNFTFNDATALWQTLTGKLNSVPGACNYWKGWRKAWYDMKAAAKSKSSDIRKHQGGTGGGHRLNLQITPIEQRVLSLVGPTSLTGDDNIIETQINLDHFQTNSEVTSVPRVSNEDDESLLEVVGPISPVSLSQATTIPTVVSPTVQPSNLPSRKRKRRVETTLEYTLSATKAYESKCKKEIDLKAQYYKSKIKVLERMAKAKEDMAKSIGDIAETAMTITLLLAGGNITTN